MAIHWQVRFVSLRSSTLYTVNIYDDNFSGTPVQLTGAATPFETQEDGDEDMFKAIRTQSGYIRIVDTGDISWRDIIPTTDIDRPVTLTHTEGAETVTDWIGFMQAQNFGAPLYETPIEREFPIQCPLTVISRMDVSLENTRIRPFAFLLWSALNTIPATSRPNQIVVQGGADAQAWLLKMVDWINFVEEAKDHTAKAKYDYGTAIEDMCEYWGWTARIMGQTLYLTCADDQVETNALVMSYADLNNMAAGIEDGTVETMFTTATIGDIFASENNNDYQNRGPNKAIVKVDPNDAPEYIIDPFDADLVTEMNSADWSDGTIENDGDAYWHYSQDVTEVTRYDLTGECPLHENSGGTRWIGASFNILQKYNGADAGGGYSEIGNVIHFSRTYTGDVFATFETVYEHCFSAGFLRMFAETYRAGEKYENGDFYAGNPAMTMKLGIGTSRSSAQWWDGRAWQSTECTFLATIGNKKPELFSRYVVSTTNYEQTSIIQTSTLYGRMFIDLYGTDDSRVDDLNGYKSFDLLNFRVEYQKNDSVSKQQFPNSGWWDVRENLVIPDLEYEAKSDSMVKEDYNIDCSYGGNDAIQPGFGLLMNADGSYMSTVSYGSDTARPEQHLANRVVNYWSTSKRRIECELLAHDGTSATVANSLTPRKMVSIDSTDMYPVAISRNWRDDVVMASLMEIVPLQTYTVSGVVTDGTNPIVGANVYFNDENYLTGNDGAFTFSNVTAGTYTITAECDGYVSYSASVSVSGNTTANIEMTPDYLCFTAIESGTFQLSTNAVSYSLDGTTWTTLAASTASPTVAAGNKILWKASLTPTSSAGVGTFSSTGQFNISGNPLSLILGDSFVGVTTMPAWYAFYRLFKNCTGLVDASELQLVCTTLLTYVYKEMFYGCTALTGAPSLPATELQKDCYNSMFRACTSLTTAPDLLATTLASGCYSVMFLGCSSLNYIKCMSLTTLSSTYTYKWVDSVASSGTFVKNSSAEWSVTGIHGIPSNWTVETADE